MSKLNTDLNIDTDYIIFTADIVETKNSNIGAISDYEQMSVNAKKTFNLFAEHAKSADKKFGLNKQLKVVFNSYENKFRIVSFLDTDTTPQTELFSEKALALKKYFTDTINALSTVMKTIEIIASEGKHPKLVISNVDSVSFDGDRTILVNDKSLADLAEKLSMQKHNTSMQSMAIKVGDKEIHLPTVKNRVVKEKSMNKNEIITMEIIVNYAVRNSDEFEFMLPGSIKTYKGRYNGIEMLRKLLAAEATDKTLVGQFYATTLKGLISEELIDYEIISIDESAPSLFLITFSCAL